MKKRGVCPECQRQEIPVRLQSADVRAELDDEPFPGIPGVGHEEVEWYVLEEHDAYGSHCNGSGQTPEAVY